MENRIEYLLQNPLEVISSDLSMLKKAIEQQPYFYHLRALYLFGLKNENHPSFDDVLHSTAAYSYDRENLYHYIHHSEKAQNKSSSQANERILKPIISEKAIASEPIDLVEEEFEKQASTENEELEIAVLEEVFDADLAEPFRTVEKIESEVEQQNILPVNEHVENPEAFLEETTTELTAQDTTDSETVHTTASNEATVNLSFGEWLKKGTSNASTPKQENTKVDPAKLDKQRVIDTFLANTPKISPLTKETTATPLAENTQHHQAEFTELMTETLAQIYLEQNKYEKAIRAYKILSLKYPKKNSYFADRISEIEKLINKK
ncbi:hypothetical protein ACF3NR_08635 [Vaginella massiliensis]|uniref:hypothetical protein n=1 Tax=Vaginella massiliensis TaxID=1816680 RepID=UPI0008386846|nr:hypothetical protein [Vaginella massiliensis]